MLVLLAWLGTAAILLSYLALTVGRVPLEAYHWANAVGCWPLVLSGLFVGLYPQALINLFFGIVGIAGIIRSRCKRNLA